MVWTCPAQLFITKAHRQNLPSSIKAELGSSHTAIFSAKTYWILLFAPRRHKKRSFTRMLRFAPFPDGGGRGVRLNTQSYKWTLNLQRGNGIKRMESDIRWLHGRAPPISCRERLSCHWRSSENKKTFPQFCRTLPSTSCWRFGFSILSSWNRNRVLYLTSFCLHPCTDNKSPFGPSCYPSVQLVMHGHFQRYEKKMGPSTSCLQMK